MRGGRPGEEAHWEVRGKGAGVRGGGGGASLEGEGREGGHWW